jgi:peptidyl-prolyl cis-trans isomerase SurA
MPGRPSRRRLPLLLLGLALAFAAALGAQQERLVDRVVAVVDEDPILASDLGRAIALGRIEREQDEPDAALRRRALDRLIEERLRQHEVTRFGFESVSVEEVDQQFTALAARLGSPAALAAELERLAMSESELRQLLARQLATLAFVEERLGPRVFVGVEEIRRYYDETLVPRLRGEDKEPPPIEEVREPIRAVLREQRLNEEIERWTAELRAEADVVDLLDAADRPLPPVVETWPAAPPP